MVVGGWFHIYRGSRLPRFGFGSCDRRHRFTVRLDARDRPEKNVARRMP